MCLCLATRMQDKVIPKESFINMWQNLNTDFNCIQEEINSRLNSRKV